MPFKVRNRDANKTIFAIPGQPSLVWGAKGQHDDTQRVPDLLADDVNFLKALDQGVFEVVPGSGSDEVMEKLDREVESTRREREERDTYLSRANERMDRPEDRSVLGANCIAPVPGRDIVCGRPVIQTPKQAAEVPPLCPEHQMQAPEFYLAETGSKGENATETRAGDIQREWKRVEIANSARSSVG